LIVKQGRLRATLLTTSSALALIVAINQSAEAATCTVVTNPGLPYAQAGNTCVTFTASPGTTGNITNTGTVTASGPSNPSGTGISLFLHPTVTGNIINQGTINANGFGVLMDQAQLNGSITNATGATLNATGPGGAGIQVQGTRAAIATEGVSGSIINNGTITAAGVGINVGDVTIGAGITNNSTITSTASAAMVVSEAMVTGNVSNSATGHLSGSSTGIFQVVNGGTINGSVQNFGTITNSNANGVGIYVYSSIGGIGTQAITGSIVNETNASISSATGIKIISVLNTAVVVIGSGHAGDGVINAGTIGTSVTPVAHSGIEIGSATVNGVVSNSGTIAAAENGIQLINLKGTTPAFFNAGPTVVTGGVTNSGSITTTGTGYAGIAVSGSTVTNGITNTNTITAANGFGILLSDTGKNTNSGGVQSTFVGGPSAVTGGVANQGTITAKTGIMVTGGSTVDSITNSGSLTGTTAAIDVTGEGAATTINQQAGTITGNILLSALADTVNITGGALSGNIVGQGSSNTVNFAPGAGNTFTYANAITGVNAVNVNSGILNLTGSIASTLTTVNSGGELMGTGTVGNTTIASNGTFAPGSGTAGTSMNVSGNLAFASSALYMVQLNPSTASFASVTGTATLGGATVKAIYANGSYVAKQYTILTATGGVSGTFGSLVNSNLPANFNTSLSYDAHDAFLNLTLNFVPPPNGGLNQNQQNVANAIVGFFNSTGSIPLVFGGLTPAGLTQASGELATGSQQTTFDAMNLFMSLLTDPFMDRSGSGANGAGATPFAAETSGYASDGTPRSKSERDAYAAIYRKAPLAAPFVPSWSVWAAGYGGSQTTNGNAVVGSNNTTSSIAGTAVGADYRFSPYTIAGFALAGGGTNFSVNGLGSGRSDLFQAGAYVRHTAGAAYISAALAYGWQDITTNRTVTIAGIDQLQARFNANAYSGRAEGGYRFVTPWMGVTPYAAAQFTTFDLPAYAEQAIVGSNTFALAYGSKDVTDTRSELGIRTDKSWAMTDSIFTLRGRFAWAHDYDPNRSIGATFQALPGASFVVNGAAQAHDSALTTASAEVKWANGWSAAATFEGEFSQVTNSYAGKGVVRYTW
jgi:uncharacterized protein with beta-barrel porin domain